jgi:type III restriction enzyme
VKNVFLIVPHKQRAFNSKLLIAQVLGRGLRVPPSLKNEGITPLISVCNHEKWTPEINDLYNEVAEIEDRLSWGYDENRKEYAFQLYNLQYLPVETTTESKETPAAFTGKFGFKDQRKSAEYKQEYAVSGELSYVFEDKEFYETDVAVANLHAYLKDKNEKLAQEWPKTRLKVAIIQELTTKGYEGGFLSKDNYHNAQRSFGSFFWELGKEVPRISLRPDSLTTKSIEDFPIQSFSEDSLRSHGSFYYTETTQQWYSGDESILFNQFSQIESVIERLEKDKAETSVERVKVVLDEEIVKLNEFKAKLILIPEKNFPSPLNALYVSFTPEIEFAKALFHHSKLFKSFIKSADKGFYHSPYSYKPTVKGKTHPRQENFNPDFFLWMKNSDDIIVVEIKKEKDDQQKNKAKFRDGKSHFDFLNKRLEETGIPDRYFLKFLSPEGNDIPNFFQTLSKDNYRDWKSILMEQLE